MGYRVRSSTRRIRWHKCHRDHCRNAIQRSPGLHVLQGRRKRLVARSVRIPHTSSMAEATNFMSELLTAESVNIERLAGKLGSRHDPWHSRFDSRQAVSVGRGSGCLAPWLANYTSGGYCRDPDIDWPSSECFMMMWDASIATPSDCALLVPGAEALLRIGMYFC